MNGEESAEAANMLHHSTNKAQRRSDRLLASPRLQRSGVPRKGLFLRWDWEREMRTGRPAASNWLADQQVANDFALWEHLYRDLTLTVKSAAHQRRHALNQ